MQVDHFDQSLNAILASPTYVEFAARLRAYKKRDTWEHLKRVRVFLVRGVVS